MVAEVTKPDFSYVWSSGGANVLPSAVKIQTGWTAEVPPFQWENAIQNRQDNAIVHLFQKGISEWDANSNYYFTASGTRSYVQGSDGIIYVAVQDSIGQNPTTDLSDTYWKVAFAAAEAGYLTQTTGDARYAQRANNLADLTNTATARTNLGVSDAVAAGIAGSAGNLKLSSTGLSALVTITAGSVCVKNTSNSQVVLNTVSITPSLAVSGVNGLDAGTTAVSTWYSVWVIWNGTTTAGLFSLSATSPTLPGGYTHKARVGWVRSDATANKFPLGLIQVGRSVQYKPAAASNLLVLPTLASGIQGAINAPTYIPIPVAALIPPTAVKITVAATLGTGTGTLLVAPNNSYGASNSATNPPPFVLGQSGTGTTNTGNVSMILESGSIYVAQQTATNLTQVFGWEDEL